MRRWLPALGAAMLLSLALAAPAFALSVSWFNDETQFFSGSTCGDRSQVTLTVRRHAVAVSVAQPLVGTKLTDDTTGRTDATITSIRQTGRGVTFTATGSDDVCANPSRYANGWETTGVHLRITYKTQERVLYPTDCSHPSFRPSRVVIACGDRTLYFDHIRWSAWHDGGASGVGTAHADDCVPNCARGRFHAYPGVTIELARVRYCRSNGDFEFSRLQYRYTRSAPPRRARTGAADRGCAAPAAASHS